MSFESRLLPAIGGFLLILTPASAQWLNYPTPGVPRNPDGKPNLAAPAPRSSEGKPDLSGIWEPTASLNPEQISGNAYSGQFVDLGSELPGGIPYTRWAADLVKARNANLRRDDPGTHCLPIGPTLLHTTPLLRKIVQTPGLLVILNERDVSYRQIFTDGRPLPIDPQPAWNGYSSGKWEGSILLVTTSGFRDGNWLDRNGSPLTEVGKLTERFRRLDYGHLEIEVTVDDAKAYTRPWTVTLKQRIVPDTELIDYVCNENEKDTQHFGAK
jgi:hypothetical protein